MRFSNDFIVPLPPDRAWATLMDIPAIAPCMPGAELTEKVDDTTYKGKVSVKLGPVALTFAGTAKFEEIDQANHAATVKAQGTDAKGRGGGAASVHFHLEPVPEGSKVLIDTDLTLSGAVAQYGRGAGLIQSVAAQIIGQFSDALKKQINAGVAAPIATSPAPEAVPAVAASHEPAVAAAPQPRPAPAPAPAPAPTPARPIGGFSLVLRALWASFQGLFRKS